jgi:hypothetical protein
VSFSSFPADWHALALTLPASGEGPVCGNDIETKELHCGNAYVLVAGGGVVVENPFITLSPTSGSQPAGGNHTVVATVEEAEREEVVLEARPAATLKRAAGKVVNFAVTGQNNGVSGTCTTGGGTPDPECKTDANGQVEFTYPDTHGAGNDTINASVALSNGLQTATAGWTWIGAPVVTPPATTTTTASSPSQAVLPAKTAVTPTGSAHLASSSRACVAASGYLASVSGKNIASVTYTLDGHKLKTLTHASGGVFSLRVHVSSGKAHHLSIHVTFTGASHTAATTLHKTLARCAARVIKPRFTG